MIERTKAQIKDVLLAPGNGAFFYDDQVALRSGGTQDGFIYVGEPAMPGFKSIGIQHLHSALGSSYPTAPLRYDERPVLWCRRARSSVDTHQISDLTSRVVAPGLLNVDASCYLKACAKVLDPHERERVPLAIQYGVSQALLRAAAHLERKTMAEIICGQFGLPLPTGRVPITARAVLLAKSTPTK